jgi:hypothetical protein
MHRGGRPNPPRPSGRTSKARQDLQDGRRGARSDRPRGLPALPIAVCRDDGSVPASHAGVLADIWRAAVPASTDGAPAKLGDGRPNRAIRFASPTSCAPHSAGRCNAGPGRREPRVAMTAAIANRPFRCPEVRLSVATVSRAWPRTDRPRPRPRRHPRRRRDGSECTRILPTVRSAIGNALPLHTVVAATTYPKPDRRVHMVKAHLLLPRTRRFRDLRANPLDLPCTHHG